MDLGACHCYRKHARAWVNMEVVGGRAKGTGMSQSDCDRARIAHGRSNIEIVSTSLLSSGRGTGVRQTTWFTSKLSVKGKG